jgi:protein-arginine kinase activator protein McsA
MKKKCTVETTEIIKNDKFPTYLCKVCGERSVTAKDLCHSRKLNY